MFCEFEPYLRAVRCKHCGRKFRKAFKCRCPTSPPEPQHPTITKRKPEGLGDLMERQLARLGITPEAVVKVKRLFGLPPTCGCKKRKEWLNKVSDWWRGESGRQS